jgi:hypothetical protein
MPLPKKGLVLLVIASDFELMANRLGQLLLLLELWLSRLCHY